MKAVGKGVFSISPLQSVPNNTLVWLEKWQPAIALIKAGNVSQEEKHLFTMLNSNTMMKVSKSLQKGLKYLCQLHIS